MKITYYGHSCMEFHLNEANILFDPFITPNELAEDIKIENIKPDYILVSHGHADHTADLVAIQKSSNAKVICIAEIARWLKNQGVENTHGMNIGGSYHFPFGKVKMVYALHSSSMPDGSYGGNPAGFVVEADGKRIYFAGDTALTYDMKLLAKEQLDWAILPIGDNFTMGINDAIRAAEFVSCKNIIGVHYNTFPAIKIDLEEAKQKFHQAGLNLHLPGIGDTITI